MSITASASGPQIAASVTESGVSVSVGGGSSVSATVSGGIGPTGPAGDSGGGGSGVKSATVVVGRADADYVCTGTLGSPTDHTTIQDAINAVQTAGGGTVLIREGVYYLGATVNVTAANVAIIGMGRSTELRAVGNYGHVLNCAITPAPTSWPGLSGLRIEHIRFESTVERTSGAAIYAQRTHNAIIRDVYLADITYGVSFGLTTPAPPAFWDGIVLDGQDQAMIDNVVGCAVNRAIHLNGWASASADFAYDGLVANCKLWGSPGTARGTAISIGPNCGGVVLDFNSINQWEYAVYAVHTTEGQGGGIITLRGGYTENDLHGYHIVGYQNVFVSDLWGSIHLVNCGRIAVIGAGHFETDLPSVEVELGDPLDAGVPVESECLVYGNANVFATGVGAGFGNVRIRKFDATSVVFTDDARLTNAREWTAATVSQAEAEAGTATTRRAWTAERVKQAIAAQRPGVPVYLQQTTPPGSGWVWFRTNVGGDVIDILTG